MGSVFHQLLTLWCHDFGLSAQNYELWLLLFVKYPCKIHCQGSGSGWTEAEPARVHGCPWQGTTGKNPYAESLQRLGVVGSGSAVCMASLWGFACGEDTDTSPVMVHLPVTASLESSCRCYGNAVR